MKRIMFVFVGMMVVCGIVVMLASMKRNRETKVQEEAMAEEINAFGFRVFRKVQDGKDVFLSPLSLSMALSMLSGGAEAKTEEAMLKTLGMTGWSKEETGAYFRRMAQTLKTVDPGTAMEIANSLWVNGDTELKKDYVRWADDAFGATVAEEDFDAPETLRKVNDWCAEKTNGKITSILDRLNSEAKMLLLNALYFKGRWEKPFRDTWDDTFHALDGSETEVTMMQQTLWAEYYENASLQAVSLPYGNGSYSAVLILPKDADGYAKFAAKFDEKAWNEIVGGMDSERVRVEVPRFKMEYEANLNDTLKGLGMSVAFSNSADFSSLAKKSLKIGLVKQKT